MRSLFIMSIGAGYGGSERSIEVLAGCLQRDVRLTVFATSPQHVAALQKILRPPSCVRRFRLGRATTLVSFVDLVSRLVASPPDAILTNTSLSAEMLAAVARLLPTVSRKAFICVRDFGWKDFDGVFKALGSAHVLVSGPALLDRQDYLVQHLAPRGAMRWSIVPPPVPMPTSLAGSEASDGYVLHLAAAELWKGHYALIRAAALLRDRGRPMQFISRGSMNNPPYWTAMHQLIVRLDLAKSFALWDWVDDPTDLLRGCLCVAVTSVSHFGGPETFGRTILEAWAHGKPVVAFDVGGAHHLIEHEHDGLLVPEGNVEALADAIQQLAGDPDLCRRLGENGMAKVKRSFTVDKVADALRAVLKV